MTEAILRSARTQLETAGVEGVTLREVARDIGVAVSALYRYVDNRDDLITELLVEAFTDHADAVDAAVDAMEATDPDDITGAIVAAFRAYRAWSVDIPRSSGWRSALRCPATAHPRTARSRSRSARAGA